MSNSRSRSRPQRYFLQMQASVGLKLVVLVAVFLAAPAFGQATVGPTTEAQDLRSIAEDHRPDSRASIPQFMIAFLERNPDAFVAGNVNMLRAGVTLEVPTVEEALAISSEEASRQLEEQMAWFSDLSEQEREALRETAQGELPPGADELDLSAEAEAVVPETEMALDPDETIDRADAVPEPDAAEALERQEAPEPDELDVVPEPPLDTDVTIDDEVPEPDPVFDPAEREAGELVPEPAESLLEQQAPDDDTAPAVDPATGEADVDAPPATAPPVTPGPGPEPGWMDRMTWWMWAGIALLVILGVLLISGLFGRRREGI